MQNQSKYSERQKEIIDICLKQFMDNGLFKTSARDLAGALDMQTSGLYYYFKCKDDIVIACAEEAAIRMENLLILPLLDYLDDTKRYAEMTPKRLSETEPMMKFFAQVCTTKEYRDSVQSVLDRLKKRHKEYAVEFAERLDCSVEEIAPYLYGCVALVANYMIFGEDFYFIQPFQLVANAVESFKKRKKI